MQYRKLGNSGAIVSSQTLGTMTFGAEADEATSFQLMDDYVAAGGNFLDTADVYSAWVPGHSGGESETVIGKWLARDPAKRDKVVIATKVGFMAGLAPTFPEGYDSAADVASIWQSFHLHNGQRNTHLLIRYIEDRRENAERWTQVLETTDVPLTFVWGMLDPVSGAHMAERIRGRLPDAPFTALEDVAHWPPLEAPERVAATLLSRQP